MITPLLAMPLAAFEGVEIEKVVMVLVFLLVAFLQWIFKLMAQAKENRERDKKAPTAEEIEARRRSWEHQTRPLPEAPAAPSAPSRAPGTSGGPMAELLENLRRSLEDVTVPKHVPSSPPPTPASRPSAPPALPHTPSWANKAKPPTPLPAKVLPVPPEPDPVWGTSPSTPLVALGTSVEHLHSAKNSGGSQHLKASTSRNTSRHHRHPLAHLLRTTIGYRQAFILREVLGPCKALENDESVL